MDFKWDILFQVTFSSYALFCNEPVVTCNLYSVFQVLNLPALTLSLLSDFVSLRPSIEISPTHTYYNFSIRSGIECLLIETTLLIPPLLSPTLTNLDKMKCFFFLSIHHFLLNVKVFICIYTIKNKIIK